MRMWSLQGGRGTVKRNCSVKTPLTVAVAVYYEDVVRGFSREATSDVARLRSSRALFREREHREWIHGGDFAGVSRKRMSFAVFLSSSSIGRFLQLFFCKKTLRRNLTQVLSLGASRRTSDASYGQISGRRERFAVDSCDNLLLYIVIDGWTVFLAP